MPRISMKLTASLVGSLALLLGAACERRTETTPEPAPGVVQEPNSLRPTPSSSATPGNASPSGNTATPSTAAPNSTATPGTVSPSGSITRPSASAPSEDMDTVPVHGTDPDMQGGGAGGAAGHGGQGGHSGHGGKSSR
jgi:hypothetical protein